MAQIKKHYTEFDPREFDDNLCMFVFMIQQRHTNENETILLSDLQIGRVENNVNLHYCKYSTVNKFKQDDVNSTPITLDIDLTGFEKFYNGEKHNLKIGYIYDVFCTYNDKILSATYEGSNKFTSITNPLYALNVDRIKLK